MRDWLYSVWYENGAGRWLLLPFEWLFRGIVALRRALFRIGLLSSGTAGAPVVVVGNIAVGGGGKTPLVGWLASQLNAQGTHVAVVSRGYGGAEPNAPLSVDPETPASVAGDEAAMLARSCGVPVIVCRDRLAAARLAVKNGAEIVLADDGLQHYALRRDLEIAVVDYARRHGNGHCLPAGPLREPISRLEQVDVVVIAGHQGPHDGALGYVLALGEVRNAATGAKRDIREFEGRDVHVVAGIAHPTRLVDALAAFGINGQLIPVADHGRLGEQALNPADDRPVLMTAKDAVKYEALSERHWVVEAELSMTQADQRQLMAAITALIEKH